ncbi:MAG: hypothetical protein H7173_09535 [Rhodoferax sp.]|nr:hypothetical protein [Pseudorhodobacter sp.]
MHFQLAVIANDNELIATLDQMKTTPSHLCIKSVAADFVFNISHGSAHNTAARCRLCTKQSGAPGWV